MHEMPNIDDANLALRLYEIRREPEMRKARSMIGSHVFGKSTAEVEKLFDYTHEENAHLRQVTSYWEIAASFVDRGIFHPAVYCDACSEGIFLYTAFYPHLEKLRESRPHFLARTGKLIQDIPAVREKFEGTLRMFEMWMAQQAQLKASKKRKPSKKAASSTTKKQGKQAKRKTKPKARRGR